MKKEILYTNKNYIKKIKAKILKSRKARSGILLFKITRLISRILSLPGIISSSWALTNNLKRNYKNINNAEYLLRKHKTQFAEFEKSLDLGCGSRPRNPFKALESYGIDIRDDLTQNIKQADLEVDPIPFKDNFFDCCCAYDFIEHIPRTSYMNGKKRSSFIEIMNEIYRVLKPNGYFLHRTPAFPAKQAFSDPTHVNIITEDTFPLYFCLPEKHAANLGYGFNGEFELVDQAWEADRWIICLLKAIK
mgnify:CR=1 FL=1